MASPVDRLRGFYARNVDTFVVKNKRYGTKNVDVQGVLARMRDKTARINNLICDQSAVDTGEAIEDTLGDLSNYCFILLELLRGTWGSDTGCDPSTDAVYSGQVDQPKIDGDVGFDLHSVEDVILQPGVITAIHTGSRIASRRGIWYSIVSRSSLTCSGAFVLPNVIDSGYTGELVVFVYATREMAIKTGDRVAQVVFHQAVLPRMENGDPTTMAGARGNRGYGSTGK